MLAALVMVQGTLPVVAYAYASAVDWRAASICNCHLQIYAGYRA